LRHGVSREPDFTGMCSLSCPCSMEKRHSRTLLNVSVASRRTFPPGGPHGSLGCKCRSCRTRCRSASRVSMHGGDALAAWLSSTLDGITHFLLQCYRKAGMQEWLFGFAGSAIMTTEKSRPQIFPVVELGSQEQQPDNGTCCIICQMLLVGRALCGQPCLVCLPAPDPAARLARCLVCESHHRD
jgi:hypothetical protein